MRRQDAARNEEDKSRGGQLLPLQLISDEVVVLNCVVSVGVAPGQLKRSSPMPEQGELRNKHEFISLAVCSTHEDVKFAVLSSIE